MAKDSQLPARWVHPDPQPQRTVVRTSPGLGQVGQLSERGHKGARLHGLAHSGRSYGGKEAIRAWVGVLAARGSTHVHAQAGS